MSWTRAWGAAAALAALVASGQVACHAAAQGSGGAPEAAGDGNQAAGGAGLERVTWLGRSVASNPNEPPQVRLSWPGTGFGAAFDGTELTADMQDLATPFLSGEQLDSVWQVVVDGGAPSTFSLSLARQTVRLAEGLSPGSHVAWVTKRTEAFLGASCILAIEAPGGVLTTPPAPPPRRIEVIGASIETGYGIGGTEGVDCGAFSPAQQNQSLAWPQLLADQLGAQLMNTSYAGKGMEYNIDVAADPVNTMPVMARLADATDFAHLWPSSAFVPDVVLVAMGSNDYEAQDANSFDANAFVRTYVDFLEVRLAEAPAAAYYVTASPQIYAAERQALTQALAEVVAQLQAAGVAGVRYLEFPEYDGQAKGCDGHPPPALHVAMAAQAAAQIRHDVGW